jgi:Ca2+-binding EF-hand superfamily protein
MFDKSGDGKITKSELGAALRLLNENPTEAEIDDMINGQDNDGSNVIEFEEFVNMMNARIKSGESDEYSLERAFKVI